MRIDLKKKKPNTPQPTYLERTVSATNNLDPKPNTIVFTALLHGIISTFAVVAVVAIQMFG